MKIAISPVTIFLPGRGQIQATHAEVSCNQLLLGVSARGHYELQREVPITPEPTDPAAPKVRYEPLVGGAVDLTKEQFASWAADDTFFAKCIVQNAGLVPA